MAVAGSLEKQCHLLGNSRTDPVKCLKQLLHNTSKIQTSFQSGNGSNKVQWDEANFSLYDNTSGCPGVTGSRSNVYTFISLGDQLFGSAVTGLKAP